MIKVILAKILETSYIAKLKYIILDILRGDIKEIFGYIKYKPYSNIISQIKSEENETNTDTNINLNINEVLINNNYSNGFKI